MKILQGNFTGRNRRRTEKLKPGDTIAYLETAAEAIAARIASTVGQENELLFMIGRGYNGSNGLSVARMLSEAGFNCEVILVYGKEEMCEECLTNLERLPSSVPVLQGYDKIPITPDAVIIDAILGIGTKGAVKNPARTIIRAMNVTGCRVISIDIPSGMNVDFDNDPDEIVHATETITIDFPKLAMLLPEAGECCGDLTVVDTGVYDKLLNSEPSDYHYADSKLIGGLIRPRTKFSSKDDFGHALLVCGSVTMTGAAILSTAGALRSGCGRVTTHLPQGESYAIHINCPSAMVSNDPEDCFSTVPEKLERFTVCGVGCGVGRGKYTVSALKQLMEEFGRPMVLDADALNIIASNPGLRSKVPAGSVLTPHKREFERLVGVWSDERQKHELLRALAVELNSTVILKGFRTMICMDDGRIFINGTGTAGLATGGSGDVLTGLITGLGARGYPMKQAAVIGVYLHGLAGEKTADYYGIEAMNSSDIVDFIGEAFSEVG